MGTQQDYLKAHMRDILATEIVKGLHVSYEAYRPAVTFVNGTYRGVYNIREKMGEDYIKENFSVKKMHLIEDDLVVKEGSSESYEEDVLAYLENHSLSSDADYNYIASKIDIENYIDYMITNLLYCQCGLAGNQPDLLETKERGYKMAMVAS